jgi:hypothetical protein
VFRQSVVIWATGRKDLTHVLFLNVSTRSLGHPNRSGRKHSPICTRWSHRSPRPDSWYRRTCPHRSSRYGGSPFFTAAPWRCGWLPRARPGDRTSRLAAIHLRDRCHPRGLHAAPGEWQRQYHKHVRQSRDASSQWPAPSSCARHETRKAASRPAR